jgi:hypothetical protein
LTGFGARETLRNLKNTDRKFWDELTGTTVDEPALPVANAQPVVEDDPEADNTRFEDDSSLPCTAVIQHVVNGTQAVGVVVTEEGDLVSGAAGEGLAVGAAGEGVVDGREQEGTERLGRGMRRKMPNTLYSGKVFWRHFDGDDENGGLEH